MPHTYFIVRGAQGQGDTQNLNNYGGSTDPTKARQFPDLGHPVNLVLLFAVRRGVDHQRFESGFGVECRTARRSRRRGGQCQKVGDVFRRCRHHRLRHHVRFHDNRRIGRLIPDVRAVGIRAARTLYTHLKINSL